VERTANVIELALAAWVIFSARRVKAVPAAA
jgi:hypothetical protein